MTSAVWHVATKAGTRIRRKRAAGIMEARVRQRMLHAIGRSNGVDDEAQAALEDAVRGAVADLVGHNGVVAGEAKQWADADHA